MIPPVDIFVRTEGDTVIFDAWSSKAIAFLRWNRIPIRLPGGTAAEHIARMHRAGLEVRSEHSRVTEPTRS
jgi:hypothetical protein